MYQWSAITDQIPFFESQNFHVEALTDMLNPNCAVIPCIYVLTSLAVHGMCLRTCTQQIILLQVEFSGTLIPLYFSQGGLWSVFDLRVGNYCSLLPIWPRNL